MIKVLIISVFFLVQILIAANIELSHDESYYWMYSKRLAWGYFDHPPMVAFIIKIFTVFSDKEVFVRLGFIILQLTTLLVLISEIGKKYFFIIFLLILGYPVLSMLGFLALPDMPLLFFSTLYFIYLKKYLEQDNIKNSSLLGVIIALMLYSKYDGLLLILATLVTNKTILRKKSFCVVFITSAFLLAPHFIWQIVNGFPLIKYHLLDKSLYKNASGGVITYLLSQIILQGFLLFPFVFLSFFETNKSIYQKILKNSFFGVLIYFLFISFTTKIELNWTLTIIPSALLVFNYKLVKVSKNLQILVIANAIIIFCLRIILFFPPEKSWVNIKKVSEFHGWENWSFQIKEKCQDKRIVANTYQYASKLSYYLKEDVDSLNISSRKNQYTIWNLSKGRENEKVCYVTDVLKSGAAIVFTPGNKKVYLQRWTTLNELKNEEI